MKKRIRTTGCFMEYEGKFIIVHRLPNLSQGNTWGLVAGKVDPGQSDMESMLEEIREETGYEADESELEFVAELVWEFSEVIVEFVTYRLKLKDKIQVRLSQNEHDAFKWVTAGECYAMKDLIHGFHDLLEKIGYVKQQPHHFKY